MDIIKQFPQLSPEARANLMEGPSMAPPPGVRSNLVNPVNSNSMAIVVLSTCLCLSSITHAFRVYCRAMVIRVWRTEDYLGVLAFLCYVGFAVTLFLHAHYGGYLVHQWDIRLRFYQKVIQVCMAYSLLFGFTMLFAKLAILLEWKHIFVPEGRRSHFFWTSWSLIVLNIILFSMSIMAESFTCVPLRALWEPWVNGRCLDKKAIDLATAYLNLFIDMFILALPQTVIWKLQIVRNKKASIAAIFSIGGLSILCAIIKIPFIHLLKYTGEGDTAYGISRIYLLTFTETTFAMLVFTVPAVPKGFSESCFGRHIMRSVRSCRRIGLLTKPGRTPTRIVSMESTGRTRLQRLTDKEYGGHGAQFVPLESRFPQEDNTKHGAETWWNRSPC
ncbi:hypothetical protein NOR_00458 [Metarhizium rileyi]|uniref:Rhodopsin domain-containing protein n=1 Tax=Metarhizium rileyi (strain RCEF 4871) TaxID=1649241 RepID=A0A162I3L1_METRR|nr:hypothetical protein NOR_00458 [Metarhizium rileyi RCEF 4871]